MHFKPEEAIDYAYDVEFVTEREKFLVPVRGWGPQPELQLPSECQFGKVEACYTSERTFLVRNIGDKAATVNFGTREPFTVLPTEIGLAPQDAVQVRPPLSCCPLVLIAWCV